MTERQHNKELEELKKHLAKLKSAIWDLTSCDEVCNVVHHTKSDRHSIGDKCPVIERYRKLCE